MEQCFNRLFCNHPRDVGESYITHAFKAACIGGTLIWWGTMEVAHAIVPGFDYFQLIGSSSEEQLENLSEYIKGRKTE